MKTTFSPVIDRWYKLQETLPFRHMGNKDPQVVLIDTGHGGLDKNGAYVTPGKRADHGDFKFFEGVWTRAIGWTFAQELYNSSRNYIIMTPRHHDIPLVDRVGHIRNISKGLKNLGHIPYVVSLHGNAFGVEAVQGVEVFTSPGPTVSDPLATIYFNELFRLGWRMRPGIGGAGKEAKFTMLTGPESHGIPALLPEIGFYTNREQAIEMCSPQVMGLIGQILRDADIKINQLNLLS